MAFKRRAWTIFEWLGPTDGQTILDCGCGRGFYLKMLRHLGTARLFGVDLELLYLRKARRNTAHLPAILVSNVSIYGLTTRSPSSTTCSMGWASRSSNRASSAAASRTWPTASASTRRSTVNLCLKARKK
jgi:protein-L-isoaspartate O-methyltransferase